jgi:alpha-galactosidase
MAKKIVLLGAGSMYFSRVLPDLAMMEGLKGSEIVLYDIDREKSEIMAGFGAAIAAKSGTGMRVKACHSLARAVDGADFALSSIGGAGPSTGNVYGTGVHRQDVLIPARYGIYQLTADTAGPGGMMMALRSIPAYIKICREMEKRCPNVILLNHSNPMAAICRALNKYTSIRTIGICHGVQIGIVYAAQLLGLEPHELETVWIGTNHYYWIIRMFHRGKDVHRELARRVQQAAPKLRHPFCDSLSAAYGTRLLFPDDSHAIEFYPFLAQLGAPDRMPYGLDKHPHYIFGARKNTAWEAPPASRSAQLRQMKEALSKIDLPAAPSDPITGEGIGVLVEAMALGRRHIHIVNIPNEGCVSNLPSYGVLELEGVTDSCGVRGVHVCEAPTALAGLLQKRIAWQELVADAAVKGDRTLALHALLTDEMAIRPELAEKMLDELLTASRDYLPQFFKARKR